VTSPDPESGEAPVKFVSADPRDTALALAPLLAPRSEEIEHGRRLPDDVAQQLAAGGFYRMFVPKACGGLETPPGEAMEAIETLARADAASAWVAFIGATSGSVLASLPTETGRAIFADPLAMIAGVYAPRGRAEIVDGGFRVEGQWAWGSGTQNADWILGGCLIHEGGEPARHANGAPKTRLMLFPASDVEHLDTWHVSGLGGTGSADFAVHERFVPDSHASGRLVDGTLDRPLYRFPQFGLLGTSIAAVAMGIARAAIEEFVEVAVEKTPSGSRRPLAARSGSQAEVARAEATLRSARAFFFEAIDAAWREALEGDVSLARRSDVRLATTHATHAAAEAVDRMYHGVGGTSVYRRSPLQRHFRDVHVATQHMMVGPATWELTGRVLLGLETDPTTL
jgi:alkylation response protein AidB-like acyl-CoA dehydrogenase